MQPDELLRGLPGYPVTSWLLVLLVFAGVVAQTWRNRPQKQSQTNARFGSRLESVERELQLEQMRRIQVEHELIRAGFILPAWPVDPPQPVPRHVARAVELDDDDDQADEYARTEAHRVTVPPLPPINRHRRSAE